MIRIWLLAAGLVLGAAFAAAAHDENKAALEGHDDALVKLTERQVEAGKFALPLGLERQIAFKDVRDYGARIDRIAAQILKQDRR